MTQEDIIRMAREAGLWTSTIFDPPLSIEHFAQLVAAAEREALAFEAERNGNTILAMQIRARGQQ